MKYNKIKIGIIAAFVALSGTSCKKFLDINQDPNNPTVSVATAELVLPAALQTTAAIYDQPTGSPTVNGNDRFVFAGLWTGSISYSGNYAVSTELKTYALTNDFGSGIWSAIYNNNADYDFIESKGVEKGNTFYQAIGKLMKAYNYQTLVDLYNNIPYSEALKGTTNPKPKYDNGVDVYEDLMKKIDESIALFEKSTTVTIKGDIMFGGDATQWLNFANTVKLRMLLRQSAKSERASYITANAANLKTTYLGSDALINPTYQNTTGKQNQFWESSYNLSGTYTEDFYRGGKYMIAFLTAHNDGRLTQIYSPASATGNYDGNYFGDQGLVNSKTSGFGPGVLKSFDQSSVLMTAAESYFLQAEAVLKGIISGDAKALYESGVDASFNYLGLTSADATTYVAQTGDNQTTWDACTSDNERLALIIRQKWIATALINQLEAYNDYRRLKLPADVPLSKDLGSTGIFPMRLLYPQREYSVNGDNANAQGKVTPSSKVWWIN